MAPPRRSLRGRWGRAVLLFAGYWLVALLTHTTGLTGPLHTDYAIYLRIARDWRAGQRLYEETYVNKPPVLYGILLAIDAPRPEVTLYLTESALIAVAALALRWMLAGSAAPRAARLAPLLLILWSGTSETFYGGQIIEALVLPANVIALALVARGAERGSLVWAGLAGAVYFLIASLRFPCLAELLAYLPLLLMAARRHGWLKAGGLVVVFITGFLVCLGAFVLHARSVGYWEPFLTMMRQNFGDFSLDRIPWHRSVLEGIKTLTRIALDNTAVLVLAAISVSLSIRRGLPRGGRQRRLIFWASVAGLWLMASLISAFPGGRHFAHYYHVLWGGLAILGALWIDSLPISLRRRVSWAIFAAMLLLALLENGYAYGRSRALRAGGQHPRDKVHQGAEAIARLIPADQPAPMFLARDWCELYLSAPRPGVVTTIPDVVPDPLLNRWAETVLLDPPEWLVVDESFAMKQTRSPQFGKLRGRVPVDYEIIEQVEDLKILRRKPVGDASH